MIADRRHHTRLRQVIAQRRKGSEYVASSEEEALKSEQAKRRRSHCPSLPWCFAGVLVGDWRRHRLTVGAVMVAYISWVRSFRE
jgi:hypothetical protein